MDSKYLIYDIPPDLTSDTLDINICICIQLESSFSYSDGIISCHSWGETDEFCNSAKAEVGEDFW